MGLLNQGFELPVSNGGGDFIRMPGDGEEIRVMLLGAPICGWEYWLADNKTTVRSEVKPERMLPDARTNEKGVEPAKFFMAFPAYNVTEKSVGILQVTQRGIQEAIVKIDRGSDFDLSGSYALLISRTGKGLKTKYAVQCVPVRESSLPSEQLRDDADAINVAGAMFPPQTLTSSEPDDEVLDGIM